VPARDGARRAARARALGPAGAVAVHFTVVVCVRVDVRVLVAVRVCIGVVLRRSEVRASSIVRVRVAVPVPVRIITTRLHRHLVRVDSARVPPAEVCHHHLRAYLQHRPLPLHFALLGLQGESSCKAPCTLLC
jgi:hypothetical protein